MHQFVRKLITEWRRLDLPFSGGTFLVAVSGGADSVSLLLAVHDLAKRKKLGHRIVAAHFNHRLRGGESDADEDYVRHLTAERGIELAVGRGDIQPGGNMEQNARAARYDFLTKTAKSLNAFGVCTGHTVNDQAETFLLNLVRGSGPDGLSGMRAVRSFEFQVPSSELKATDSKLETPNSKLLLIRPLLSWAKRTDTEAYCHDLGVAYRYDTMNDDTAFKRVRIRKILLPLLEDLNPKIVETLANTAGLMQNLSDAQQLAEPPDDPAPLTLDHLKSLATPELYNTLRRWLRTTRGSTRQLELKHIQAIERLIFSQKSGKTVELPDSGRVVRSGGKLTFEKIDIEN